MRSTRWAFDAVPVRVFTDYAGPLHGLQLPAGVVGDLLLSTAGRRVVRVPKYDSLEMIRVSPVFRARLFSYEAAGFFIVVSS